MDSKRKLTLAILAFVIALGIGNAARGDDATCQDGVAMGSRNIGNQEQKKNRKCVKAGRAPAGGIDASDVDACVDAESAATAVQRTKLADLFALGGKCDPVPAVGVNPLPNDIADATEQASGDILRAVFGDPVDGIVAGSKCDDKIAKRAGKKFDTELKAFRACVKKGAPLATQAAVDACVAAAVNDAKAQSTVQPTLAADIVVRCTTSPPEGADDGDCSSCADFAACATCIGDVVDCQACLAMNNSSNGTVDCDALDDGVVNSSCTGGPVVDCPLAAGKYTVTQGSGGIHRLYTFVPFSFPAGGKIVLDVAAGTPPACVHDVVVPFPGGFNADNFCLPALNEIMSVTQTGCGIGQVDSNGGSDYKVEETNDTSNSGTPCNLPQAGCVGGADASTRVGVTISDGAPDVCAGTGTANVIVTIPVHTKVWADFSAGSFGGCSGDGVLNGTDLVVAEFDQVFDFTSDEAHASWMDLPDNGGAGDGCFLAGFGPAGGQALVKGECIDLSTMAVKVVAAGGLRSTFGALGDGSFSIQLPSTIALTGPFAGDTCGSPPPINFAGGTATRCLQ